MTKLAITVLLLAGATVGAIADQSYTRWERSKLDIAIPLPADHPQQHTGDGAECGRVGQSSCRMPDRRIQQIASCVVLYDKGWCGNCGCTRDGFGQLFEITP